MTGLQGLVASAFEVENRAYEVRISRLCDKMGDLRISYISSRRRFVCFEVLTSLDIRTELDVWTSP